MPTMCTRLVIDDGQVACTRGPTVNGLQPRELDITHTVVDPPVHCGKLYPLPVRPTWQSCWDLTDRLEFLGADVDHELRLIFITHKNRPSAR